MSKLKTKPKENIERDDRINRALSKLTHKALQKECVLRGIEFQRIVDWDHHALSNWFYHNFELGENPARLAEYDAWLEGQLQERGYKKGDALLHPSLRFGFTPDMDKLQPPPVTKSLPKPENEEPRQKREKDEETGVYKGTKKALTYQLSKQDLPIPQIIDTVMKAFPEAKDKSITIWVKRERKARNN